MRQVAVEGATLEVSEWGSGEPVLLIQTALTADELLPLAREPALEGYRKILYHRRGYAGSSPVDGPGSIPRDARDARGLLSALGIAAAHVVGVSYSAAVALQLAADAPAHVHSLALLEPPPVHTPRAAEFRAANDRLLARRDERGAEAALEELLSMVIGPDWHAVTEGQLPGSAAQMVRDAATFFDTDLPALLAWRFDGADAGRITGPVAHIGGSDSGPWFAGVRPLMRRWFPQAHDVVIDGAGHTLTLTHPRETGAALAAFLAQHPLDGGASPA